MALRTWSWPTILSSLAGYAPSPKCLAWLRGIASATTDPCSKFILRRILSHKQDGNDQVFQMLHPGYHFIQLGQRTDSISGLVQDKNSLISNSGRGSSPVKSSPKTARTFGSSEDLDRKVASDVWEALERLESLLD